MMKTRTLAFHDRQHMQRILMQQNAVGFAFSRFIATVSPHLRKWSDRGGDSVWVRNSPVEKAIDNALIVLQSTLYKNINDFQFDAWKRANLKNDEMIDRFIQGMSLSFIMRDGMFRQNMEAFKGLQKEVDANGLNLSQKVWSIADQAKMNLEFYLNSGISSGRSADGISRDIRQMLNNPDKRFRRVKDEDGKLKLSKPMEDYHPGAGVYRSSRMNALRLASTKTNMAYRKADYERWQNLDFILGIDIRRSPSNHGPCKICDAMVGKYPKDFQFLGFHPFCICIATPILQKPEDFADFLLDGEIPKSQLITDIPAGARKFMLDNEYMQKSYTFRDNKGWFNGDNHRENKSQQSTGFVKCKSIPEAVERAKSYGIKSFHVGDAPLSDVNIILEAIHDESKHIKIDLEEFRLEEGRTFKGRKNSGGYYSTRDKKIVMRMDSYSESIYEVPIPFDEQLSRFEKSKKDMQSQLDDLTSRLKANKGLSKFLKDDIKMLKGRIFDLENKIFKINEKIKEGKEPLPWTVSTTFKDRKDQIMSTVHHEIGHYVHYTLLDYVSYKRVEHISEYGASAQEEGFAEWYSYYRMKGEAGVPSVLLELFKKCEKMIRKK